MRTLLFILITITQLSFSQTIIVHDKNDPRLIAYRDSVKCYLHGLNEVRIAKNINRKHKNDTAVGRYYKHYVETQMDKLNPDIKPIKEMKQDIVLYRLNPRTEDYSFYTITYLEETCWIPELWKKPAIKVVYEKINKEKENVKINTVLQKDTANKKTIFRREFYVNGKRVSKDDFEKVYGKKISDSVYTVLNNKTITKNGMVSKN